MHRRQVDSLDPSLQWWAAALVAPERNWAGAPGCRRGARYLVDGKTFSASREEFQPFASRLDCLQWIMEHRLELSAALPGAAIRAVRLDRWLLGLE